MTKEEAKDYIREWCPYNRQEEIIKALEQETCEDAVSRQAVLDLINADWKYEGLEEPINSLPPVTPQPKSEWQQDHEILKAYSDGANDVLDHVRAEIDAARFVDKDTKHCRNANATGLEVALDIIDKFMAESEDK